MVTILLVLTVAAIFATSICAIQLKQSLETFNSLSHAKVWQMQAVSKKMETELLTIAILNIVTLCFFAAAILVMVIA